MKTIRVLSGGAAQGLVDSLRASFEARTGCRIDGVFGAVGAMKARLLAGEPADVLILSRALIDGLARDGHAVDASAKDIGAVQTAVAVRRGDPLPALGDAAQLRAALLAADAIHFPDPEQATAGIHFARVMKELGLWDELADRLKPAPNGATAMRALAASTSRRPIGCTQATEILATPGIVLVAPLPPGCDLATVYACALAARSVAPARSGRAHRDTDRRRRTRVTSRAGICLICSERRYAAEMAGSFDQIDHLSGGMDRQRVMGEARPGRDVGRHFAGTIELPVGRVRQQGDHQVLQRDHAHAELHQFGIRERRHIRLRFGGRRFALRPLGTGAPFVVPARQRHLALS